MFNNWLEIFIVALTVFAFASSSGLFSEKSGIVNIAIDGTMIVGAFTFITVTNAIDSNRLGDTVTKSWAMYVALLVVIVVGAIWSLLLSAPTITFMSDHVITGTAINMLAPALTILIMKEGVPVGAGGGRAFMNFYSYRDITVLGFSAHHLIFLGFAAIMILTTWIVLTKTRFGLRIKSAGENPSALEAAGVNVNKIKYIAVTISGILAALAGAFASNLLNHYFTGSVKGLGFIAIAILIMSQWNVIGIVLSSIAFSAIYSISKLTLDGVAPQLLNMIPFFLPLITLMLFKSRGAPAAVGLPYNKEQR